MVYRKFYDFKVVEDKAKKRADWFMGFNHEATKVGAWIISSPGAAEVTIEALPGNDWIEELKERGFPIKWLETGSRVVPYAYSEPMMQNADGTLAPLTLGSTREITLVKREPGIARTERYTFRAPF
jgi:hypothetical protein